MKRRVGWLVILSALLALTACAPKSVVVLIPDPDGQVGKVAVSNPGGSQMLEQSGEASFIKDGQSAPQAPVVMTQTEIQRRFGRALAARPIPPETFILYFHPNSSDLSDSSQALLPEIVRAILERHSVDVSVVGHGDTVGNDQYNIKLSRQRAEAVARLLTDRQVDPKIFEITSHGKRRLLVPTGENVNEPRNRRVEVTVR
jgi:outer membrane protein OmpA-like peptidoglycan-associated protein